MSKEQQKKSAAEAALEFVEAGSVVAGKAYFVTNNEPLPQGEIIGKLLASLESEGLTDNTMVVFTSDNGGGNAQRREVEGETRRFNGPLREGKRSIFEGGIRVPTVACWPGKIQPGRVSDHVCAFWDLMPTFGEVAGTSVPDDIDGISFAPTLLGEKAKQKQHDYLYWELQIDGWGKKLPKGGFRQAIRKGDWKAVRYGSESNIEIYNLKEDINETNDLASENIELVEEMEGLFSTSRTETAVFPYGGKLQDYRAKDRYNANLIVAN